MKAELFESYLSRVLDHDLTPEEFADFEQHLADSPEARSRYMDYIDLHNIIDLELQQNAPTQLGTSKVVDIKRIIRRQKRRSLKIATIAAAAVLLLALITMRLFFVSDRPPALVFQTSPGTQYSLTHSGMSDTPEGLVLEQGSRLKLSQGTVELTFESGVKSIIMAPADLTLHKADTLYLNKGTAWFQVPQQAIGFTVKTKDLQVIDLGTEFGVLAHPENHDEVHVFKGKVQVNTSRLRKASDILTAGEARRIDPIGRLTKIPTKARAFLTARPTSLPYIHWSFDRNKGLQAEGTHPAVADIVTNAKSETAFTQGKQGLAISLDGISQHYTTNWPGFEGHQPRTASFWLKLSKDGDYSKFPGIVGWGDRTGGNAHKWKVMVVNQKKSAPTRIRLSWGNVWFTSQSPVTPSEWHHVTVTSNGNINQNGYPEAEIYIDGQKQDGTYGKQIDDPKSLTYETSTKTRHAIPLLIGADLFTDPDSRNFFNGAIDELYIFDGHMTEDEVQKIYNR